MSNVFGKRNTRPTTRSIGRKRSHMNGKSEKKVNQLMVNRSDASSNPRWKNIRHPQTTYRTATLPAAFRLTIGSILAIAGSLMATSAWKVNPWATSSIRRAGEKKTERL